MKMDNREVTAAVMWLLGAAAGAGAAYLASRQAKCKEAAESQEDRIMAKIDKLMAQLEAEAAPGAFRHARKSA